MFRFKRGLVLASVVAAVLIVTIAAPDLFDWLDPQFGSYIMVGVALVAAGIWWWARRRRD